jgi:hypothetical protein
MSVNKSLLHSAFLLALQAGLRPSMHTELMSETTFASNVELHVLYFSVPDTEELAGYSRKVSAKTNKTGQSRSFLWRAGDGTVYLCSEVKKIKRSEEESLVYNLSVEEDESYTAEGFAVHNCGYCGHAYTKQTPVRCDHTKFRKLSFDDKGNQIVILCSDGIFFDQSYVGNNPAAKIALGLRKIAQAEEACTAVQRPEDIVTAEVSETLKAGGMKKYSMGLMLKKLAEAEKEISTAEPGMLLKQAAAEPGDDIRFVRICRTADPQDLLNILAAKKIILSPTQWWRIFNGDENGEPVGVSDFLRALRGVFGRYVRKADRGFLSEGIYLPTMTPPSASLRVFDEFEPVFRARPEIKKTVIIRTASPEAGTENTGHSPGAEFLAAEYARYQTSCLSAFAGPSAAHWCAVMNHAGL